MTIHKSQGSEYPAVVIPVMTQHYAMLQRNLNYTGITRGKRLVVLVGQKKAVAIAVRNVSGGGGGQNWRNGCNYGLDQRAGDWTKSIRMSDAPLGEPAQSYWECHCHRGLRVRSMSRFSSWVSTMSPGKPS